MPGFLVKSIGIIGLGLIGGSFARALKSAQMVERVFGFDAHASEAELAVRLGVIDEACKNLPELATNSQIIVLATPVKTIETLLRELAPYLTGEHVLTDMGSVKAPVVATVRRVFGELLPGFVPGHPIAGSEKSGVAAAVTDLFVEHKTILTPLSETCTESLELVTTLWQATGAEVLMMSPHYHDEVLAATSHLPHLIAFSLVDTLAGADNNKDIFRYAAGGFRDFTRIAASDPVMWHDIYLSNREAVLKAVDEFSKDLNKLRLAIEQGDGETLLGVFTRAKAARVHFGNMLAGNSYITQASTAGQSCAVAQGSALSGSIRLCADKSICHRMIVFAALANGTTRIQGFSESETSLATLQAFRDMGVVIEGPDRGELVVHGVGLFGLKTPAGALYAGHSDSSMRLLAGIMSGQSFSSEIVSGEHSEAAALATPYTAAKQNLSRLVKSLRELGADIACRDNGRPPLIIKGKQRLIGREYHLHETNAEIKTCLLLAALYADGKTTIKESCSTRDHTERLLMGFGYPIQISNHQICLVGRQELPSYPVVDIPVDFTLAFYFVVAAAITAESDLKLLHVGINDRRLGALSVLKQMGASVAVLNSRKVANEWVAEVSACAASLSGYVMTAEHCIEASEELPALVLAACFAESPSRISGLSQLPQQVRELLDQAVKLMTELGGNFSCQADELVINARKPKSIDVNIDLPQHPGVVLAGMVFTHAVQGRMTLCKCAEFCSSYPGIIELLNEAGFNINYAD